MRYCIFFLFLVVTCSCNSGDEEPAHITTTKADINNIAEENNLVAIVNKYPDSLPPLQNLASYYLETEKYDQALSTINGAIKRDSMNPELWDMRSVVEVAKSDTPSAIRSLENAIQIYPAPDYIISLGALYAQTGNGKALTMADALLVGNRSKAEREAYFIKGLYYSFTHNKEKAIPFFDQAIATDFQFMEAYLEKALALYDLKKYEEAVTVLNRAVLLQNNFDRGYYYLGRCYEKLNKKEEAKNAYRKALLYDPQYAEAADALSKLE